jgi:hypothetical protein
MKKFALFAFNGDPMCFIHVLLNALDLKERGYETVLIIEGSTVKLVGPLGGSPGLDDLKTSKPAMFGLLAENFAKVRDAGLIGAVCRACSVQLGVLEAVEASGLPLSAEMKGHPPMGRYIADGWEILTF